MMRNNPVASIVDENIRARCTTKVYADHPRDERLDRDVVTELLNVAGWAPFHRTAARVHTEGVGMTSAVPWRFYLLDAERCRTLRRQLMEIGDESKVPRMLAAATTLALVTWLPNPQHEPFDGMFEPTVQNMEHIAAAAAAIQNFLLAACARGIPTYWSSGGPLRGAEAFGWLGIPDREILLGSVYLFPSDLSNTENVSGSLREKRGDVETWSRWVD